jgi:hypothetical protein
MTPNRPLNPFEPSGERREFAQLAGRIQTLTLELQRARRRGLDGQRSTPTNAGSISSAGNSRRGLAPKRDRMTWLAAQRAQTRLFAVERRRAR